MLVHLTESITACLYRPLFLIGSGRSKYYQCYAINNAISLLFNTVEQSLDGTFLCIEFIFDFSFFGKIVNAFLELKENNLFWLNNIFWGLR